MYLNSELWVIKGAALGFRAVAKNWVVHEHSIVQAEDDDVAPDGHCPLLKTLGKGGVVGYSDGCNLTKSYTLHLKVYVC